MKLVERIMSIKNNYCQKSAKYLFYLATFNVQAKGNDE
jgi:hypothetical protein